MAVLEGDLGQQLEELTSHLDLVDNKKIEYLKKLDKWEQVYALALQLLQKRYENFEFWPSSNVNLDIVVKYLKQRVKLLINLTKACSIGYIS